MYQKKVARNVLFMLITNFSSLKTSELTSEEFVGKLLNSLTSCVKDRILNILILEYCS